MDLKKEQITPPGTPSNVYGFDRVTPGTTTEVTIPNPLAWCGNINPLPFR